MSKELEIDGVRFESSASVAQRFNYTQDYVGRLAREGKVTATKVGRFWFVDVASFKQFIKNAEEEKLQRSEALREERKRERVVVAGDVSASPVQKERVAKTPVRMHTFAEQYAALAQAVAVVFCGLLVGTLGWTAQGLQVAELQQGGINMLAQLQEVFAFSYNVAPGNAAQQSIPQAAAIAEAVAKQQVFTELPILEYEQNVVTEKVSTKESEYPFSDEVELLKEDEGVLLVRPLFDEVADEVEYRVSVEAVNLSTR